MEKHKIPYNVIIVEQNERSLEELIDSYMDLFGPENSEHQIRVALEMFADELSLIVANELIKKQISKHLEVLQELRDKKFEER
jgi:nitrogen-specific signal transduction histidine kinase